MLEETKAILTILFRDYWSTPTQKEKILSLKMQLKIELKKRTELNTMQTTYLKIENYKRSMKNKLKKQLL